MDIELNKISSEVEEHLKLLLGEKLKKLILYGSYARGDFNSESDIDFFILTDLNEDQIRTFDDAISKVTFELSLKYGKIISIIIKNEDFFYKYVPFLPYYSNVISQGKIIYG